VTQTSDETSTKPDAADLRRQLLGKHVCPFCGVIRADVQQPCPRCTMEDTTSTRSATRQRIGPWFVLQARNPSAPGMRYATLLSLVKKGHVTAKSIVRGPTTHQLWTFAASVRGLSREFSICFHCGEALASSASACDACGKNQEPHADPDLLLEPAPDMLVTSMPTTPDTGMDGGTSLDLQVNAFPDEPPAPRPAVPRIGPDAMPASIPSTSASSASSVSPVASVMRQITPPSTAPTALASRQAVDRLAGKDEKILTARELAAAFQLDFNPPGEKPRKKFPILRSFAAILFIGVVGAAVVLALRPDWRDTSAQWASEKWSTVRATLERPATPANKPLASPAQAKPAIDKPVANKPVANKPVPSNPVAPSVTKVPEAVPPFVVTPDVPAPSTVVEPIVTKAPEAIAANQPVQSVEATADNPIDIPSDMSIDQATELGKKLRLQGMDAEAGNNFRRALRIYEAIQRLPRDAWPADLTLKLEAARRRAQ